MLKPSQAVIHSGTSRSLSHKLIHIRTMATASSIQLHVDHIPVYHRPGVSSEATKRASELLQHNHDRNHIFFNASGFHNHIAHHLLTIWALKGSPQDIQRGFDINQSYQRPLQTTHTSIVLELHDPEKFAEYLGTDKYYNDFLEFFQDEIEKKGWQNVLNEYVFAGDARADNMLVRMFAGFLHPLIHLGFGIEFLQPAIMAEALAQAACHEDWIAKFFLPSEEAAKEMGGDSKSIVDLLDEIHADQKIRDAPYWSDGNKIRDGVLARAGDRMIDIASQIRVKPEQLEEKVAEMTNAAAYYTGGAQRADKVPKFDFFYMHCVNCSIFFPAFLKQEWLSTANKVRLLEWKIRLDLIMYASRKSPEIRLVDIHNYKPMKPSDWYGIEDRACAIDDDGHASKLIRAIANGAIVSKPYETRTAFRLKHDDWLRLGHMAMDSVEMSDDNWVRSAGFDEAWEKVPARLY